ncbi:hypothetical protein LBMAG42_39330 [Deltaproteobacteria bacterium]|nr:hypothetical protein LBMAG42_39330 [Deltaproteobacteria bacterium]
MLFFLLVGCRYEDASVVETGDTAAVDGASPDLFADPDVVGAVWPMVLLPPQMVKWLASRVAGEDRPCPALTDRGDGQWTMVGDCTDSNGYEFTGIVEFEGISTDWPWFGAAYSATWSTFGWYQGDAGTVLLSGTQTGTGSDRLDLLDSPLSITGSVMGEDYHVVFAQHTMVGFAGMVSGSDPWSVIGVGDVDLGATTFNLTITSEGAYADGCSAEPGSGEAVLTGPADAAMLSFDGAATCDGCIPYTTASGATGTVCGG